MPISRPVWSQSVLRPVESPTTAPQIRGYERRNFVFNDRFRPFDIHILGDRHCEDFDFIFPERLSSVRATYRRDVSHLDYDRAFSNLTPDQRQAVIDWTGPDDLPIAAMSEYVGHDLDGPTVHNFKLNRKLAWGKALQAAEFKTVRDLSAALAMLPTSSGEFISMTQYGRAYPCLSPWGPNIRVDDVVSGHPCFLNAITAIDDVRDFFFEKEVRSGRLEADQTFVDTVAIYKIKASPELSTAVSLVPGISIFSQKREETKVLFHRGSCFRVDGIAIAQDFRYQTTGISLKPLRRVGVLMTQVYPPVENVKSIFTGLGTSMSYPLG